MTIKKKIAVIGTGPAGFAAAYVLGKAGFDVTVFEKSSTVGGKVTSYCLGNKSYEHGIHGWWHNYENWINIIRDAGLDEKKIFKQVYGSTLITPDGKQFPMRVLPFPLPSPLFMVWQLFTAPYLKFKDFISVFRIGIALFSFDQKRDYEKFDQLSFQELMDACRVSKNLQDLLFTPFILSFDFTVPSRVSAACGLSGMNFYVIRDQLSICTRWLTGTPNDLIFDPLRKKMVKDFKVKFYTGAKVSKVLVTGTGKSKAVGLKVVSDQFASDKPQTIAEVRKSQFPVSGYKKLDGYNILVGKQGEQLVAFDSTCSHNGCSVNWVQGQNLFECPCHGGKYNSDGTVKSGPPPLPLKKYELKEQGDNVLVTSTLVEKEFQFDEIVVAADVVNAKNIMINSLAITHPVNQRLSRLDTTPVIVVRCWFKGINYEPSIDSAITPSFSFIDNFFNLNSFSTNYDAQGHVIEIQAYRVFGIMTTHSDEQIRDLVVSDLKLISSKYCIENLTDFSVNRHSQLFTRYAPQLNGYRPTEVSGIDNLYFAGDWTSFNYPVWMMERAVSSGVRAANRICKANEVEGFPLVKLDKGNWLFILTHFLSRALFKFSEFRFKRFFRGTTAAVKYRHIHVIRRTRAASGLFFEKPLAYSWHDWVTFLLHTAAEIEHSLMVQYLFAGYSIKPVFGSPEFEMVNNWKTKVMGIAVEEMGHLLTVQRILKTIRAPVYIGRESYPHRSDFYPFPFELTRFSREALCKYIVAEMPNGDINDELKGVVKIAGINIPASGHLNNTGILYQDIISIISDVEKIPDSLIDSTSTSDELMSFWSFYQGIISDSIKDREGIIASLKKVADQGEGVNDQVDSHFERFLSIYREFDTLDDDRVAFVSSRTDPNPTTMTGFPNTITDRRALLWAKILNEKYRLMLCILLHLLSRKSDNNTSYQNDSRTYLLGLLRSSMSGWGAPNAGMNNIATRLFELPLSDFDKLGTRAGPTFELPFTLSIPDDEIGRWYLYINIQNIELGLLGELVSIDQGAKEVEDCQNFSKSVIETANKFIDNLRATK